MGPEKATPRVFYSVGKKKFRSLQGCVLATLLCILVFGFSPARAQTASGESVYTMFSSLAGTTDAHERMKNLNDRLQNLSWDGSKSEAFTGNLRVINAKQGNAAVYLLRKLSGDVYLLAIDPATTNPADLARYSESKMQFKVLLTETVIDGNRLSIARLDGPPQGIAMEKIFKTCIVLMLFFVMVGMGMTLTLDDFALVFRKPKGIILGQVLQFGVMPLLAVGLGHLLGFHETYPFIFVGFVLITAIPGGVTSNLMTYYAKGDLALSISLTSFSTLLSIIFTPLLLAFYCANMPEISIPVPVVVQTISILVIIPLAVGMAFRKKWETAAQKATPFFSALGLIALLVLIGAGIFGNLSMFADTARYGIKFYSTVFLITMAGMLLGLFLSKAGGIDNYQTRAISLETGLRNSALAMTIALLIQDSMGDFHSSMFFTSGIFGLVMYLAGGISIVMFKFMLPLEEETAAIHPAPQEIIDRN